MDIKWIDPESLAPIGNILIELAVLLAAGFIAIKVILMICKKYLDRSGADPVLHTFVLNGTKLVLGIVLIVMCLGILGVPIASVVAVLGAAGAAIALALRDSLANIAGGVMIIITKPFGQGDLVDVGDVRGKVEKIDLFLTTLKTLDNKSVTIPNGLINTSVLINHSREQKRRIDCQFGISYDADIAKAKSVIWEVIAGEPLIVSEPEPLVAVASHGESAVVLDVFVWCENEDYWPARYSMEEHVKLAFDEKGIEIPYNQVDVRIRDSK